MKKRIWLLCLLTVTALVLSGCALRTIDELYAPPKRSEAYSNLQAVVDIAMAGLEYSAPLSGEHQQAVQTADLDGDGVEEYLVFAKGMSDKPMQILIFRQTEDGSIQIEEVIATNGSAFDLVEYAQIDGKPGLELVVGRQVSDQLMKSAAVYSFANGRAFRLMNAGYSRLMTYDMGGSEHKELLMIQRGDSETDNAIAVLYRYRSKSMVRSVEVPLSQPADHIKRVTEGKLQCGTPAVYISSTREEDSAIVTDILMSKAEKLINVALNNEESGVQTLRNYYVYPEDVDKDGVVELPSLVLVKPMSVTWGLEEQYQIRWYSMDQEGSQTEKLISFHNFADDWYLELSSRWSPRIKVYQVGSNYAFYLWDKNFEEAQPIFTIYSLSGSDRETQAGQDGRFALYRTEDVIYAARIENPELEPDITQEYLINSFHLIHRDWNSGAA